MILPYAYDLPLIPTATMTTAAFHLSTQQFWLFTAAEQTTL